jgi:hypothetical protein
MIAAELELKSPSVPLFQRGNFLCGLLPSLTKREMGDFWAEWRRGIIRRTLIPGHELVVKVSECFESLGMNGKIIITICPKAEGL